MKPQKNLLTAMFCGFVAATFAPKLTADEVDFNRYALFNLHAALAESLLPYETGCGCLRRERIGVTGISFQPLQDPGRIEENFERILSEITALGMTFTDITQDETLAQFVI